MSSAFALVRTKNYRTFLAAQLISSFGDSIMRLAAGIWVQKLTGSNSSAALTFVFALLPALLAPFAGAIVDRVPRRAALMVLNLVAGLGVLPLLAVRDASGVPLIYAIVFLNGMLSMAIQPAQSALLVEVASERDLASMNGLLRTFLEAFKLASPAVGVGLFVLSGPITLVLIDSVTSFVAVGILVRLPGGAAPQRPEHTGGFAATFFSGFRFIRGAAALWRLTIICAIFMVSAGLIESLRWSVITEGLGKPAEWTGPLQMAMGLGSIACGLISPRLIERFGALRTTGLALGMFGAGCIFWLTQNVLVVLLGAVLIGGASTTLVVAVLTLLQRETEGHLQGKVFTAFELITTGPQIASVGLGAYLITVFDYRYSMTALALVSLVLAAVSARRSPVTQQAEPVVSSVTASR